MQHYETGDRISSPLDHASNAEGVNVHFSRSNFESKEYYQLLRCSVFSQRRGNARQL